MRWTYNKVKRRGFQPCWYKTDEGNRVAWIEREGPKWLLVRFATGERKRKPVSEKRYMTPMKSKRG